MPRDVLPPAPCRGGFSLIEVMGAVLILSVALGSVLRLATSITTRLEYVRDRAQASRLAEERSDSLRLVSYGTLVPRTWVDTVTRADQSWRLTQSVTQWSARLRRIQVTVQPVGDSVPSGQITTYKIDAW